MKRAKRVYTKEFDKKVFFKHGNFAQYNKVNPSSLAITTSAFVTEVLVSNFSRGQDSEGRGNQMCIPAQAEEYWQCSPCGH